jgi:hypothetical protein
MGRKFVELIHSEKSGYQFGTLARWSRSYSREGIDPVFFDKTESKHFGICSDLNLVTVGFSGS